MVSSFNNILSFRMKLISNLLLILIPFSNSFAQHSDSIVVRKIYDEALLKGNSYKNLEYLCKKIGPRQNGSENSKKAVDWVKKQMEQYGLDQISLQEVSVPVWLRGTKEKAYIIDNKEKIDVPICALGNSLSTPNGGITSEVIEVKDFRELKQLDTTFIKGKIVFFNQIFDPAIIETSDAYLKVLNQRLNGASQAAKYGAVGVIIRSLTPSIDNLPHTGIVEYDVALPKIPVAAISTKAAEDLSKRLQQRKLPTVKFHFEQKCETLSNQTGHNIIGEIKGEKQNEVILLAAHLDSWDLGEGAHDDGVGCIQILETLRIFKKLGFKPKHTIRVVMFADEENQLSGAKKYAEIAAKKSAETYIAALETDLGGFTPRGFTIDTQQKSLQEIEEWSSIFRQYGADKFVKKETKGSDIHWLRNQNTILIDYKPDTQRYFDIHHTALDTFEQVNKRELELGTASIAALVYLIDKTQ